MPSLIALQLPAICLLLSDLAKKGKATLEMNKKQEASLINLSESSAELRQLVAAVFAAY